MIDRTSPTIIAMHHPPFRTLIGPMDALGVLGGAERLEDVVACHRQVGPVICGHVHRTIFKGFGGAVVSCCPSPAHQVNLDFSTDAPFAWVMEPSALHLHVWSITEGLTSHVVPIGVFDGLFPFGKA